RPNLTDNYNKVLFDLADYYNAQIGQEQDRGDTVGYALRMQKIHRLAAEFELGFDETIKNQNHSTNRFGVKIGSGKKNPVKIAGNLYIRDWLYTPRGVDANGREILNLHTIYDPGLLQELSA